MPIEWTNMYRRFKGLWVALTEDEQHVIASGKTVKEAMLNARRKGHTVPILTRMPSRLGTYVGRV